MNLKLTTNKKAKLNQQLNSSEEVNEISKKGEEIIDKQFIERTLFKMENRGIYGIYFCQLFEYGAF
jgi:hypothetical protein